MADLQLVPFEEDTRVALLHAEEQEIRMVLIGKTGAGKSRTGNTILGKTAFKYSLCASSVTSQCEKETGEFEGQILSVVDTPGLFDTRTSLEEVKMEIARCISFAAPGPHVFLVVIHPGRFTKEEQKTVKIIQEVFGKEAAAYTMVVFTHGDDLKDEGVSIEESINGNPALRAFISQCGGGYIVFNNKVKEPDQVRDLLKKISTMTLRNGGSYFNNEMLQEARKAILNTMINLLRENLEMKLEVARGLAERNNAFLQGFRTSHRATSAILIGVGTGSALGSLAGPAGTAVGVAVGATVGTICAVAIVVKREACSIQ